MSRGKPAAVVFDLDGTLVDSLPLVLAAITHATEPYGGRPTMDIFAHLGGPPERFMAGLVKNPADVPEAVRRMVDFHEGNEHLIQPFAGAIDLLARLREAGVRTGVWTGRDRRSTERVMRRHALEGVFGAVVCCDDLATHKPDPAGLIEILRRLGAGPSETIFVGDADVDILGGAAAGVDTLLIRHARAIAPGVMAQSWRAVEKPADAYNVITALCAGITQGRS
ncbi:MAG: HAD family hydrolase [Opitutaceae bacterium]